MQQSFIYKLVTMQEELNNVMEYFSKKNIQECLCRSSEIHYLKKKLDIFLTLSILIGYRAHAYKQVSNRQCGFNIQTCFIFSYLPTVSINLGQAFFPWHQCLTRRNEKAFLLLRKRPLMISFKLKLFHWSEAALYFCITSLMACVFSKTSYMG